MMLEGAAWGGPNLARGRDLESGVTPDPVPHSLGSMLRPAAARSRLRGAAATDRTLVERMSRGDEAAFRDLLARYRSTMYATAYAALVDPEQVDATVADAFAEARRTAAGFLDSLGTVSGWLTYLTRLCIAARLPIGRPTT